MTAAAPLGGAAASCAVASVRAQEVALADLDPAVPQNIVRGGGVEEQIWQAEMQQVRAALERHLALPGHPRDVAGLCAFDLRRREILDERQRLLDALLDGG